MRRRRFLTTIGSALAGLRVRSALGGEAPDLRRLLFLGTCAGLDHQGDPTGPRDIHGYTMLYVPPNAVVDFAADARDKMRYWGVNERDVDHILITHSHYDHFDAPTVIAFAHDRWQGHGRKTSVYADETSFGLLRAAADQGKAGEFLDARKVVAGDRIAVSEGVAAVAIPSSHWTVATPLNYILEFRGRKILYAVDSAAFSGEMIEALRGHHLDVLIADCTWLGQPVDPAQSGHMNFEMVCKEVAGLRERGTLADWAPCYITHMALSTPEDYRAFAPKARRLGLRMTHDGMTIFIP
jgi:phosphoribosyl 1,2-cyclic phosphate phosphodiesterase